MRRAALNKLKSQQGAAMLLALLFLLICAMVSASILMAAAANAGRRRSNAEEHQTYLALSSAVSLLCGQLSQGEYTGRYAYWTTEEPVTVDGEETTETRHHFKQLPGVYTGSLDDLLAGNFDALFAQKINASLVTDDTWSVSLRPSTALEHTLTITPQTGTGLDGRPVTVTLTVAAESYAIYLTAVLDGYTVRAELTPTESAPELPPELMPIDADTAQIGGTMKWKIGWITTGEEEGS